MSNGIEVDGEPAPHAVNSIFSHLIADQAPLPADFDFSTGGSSPEEERSKRTNSPTLLSELIRQRVIQEGDWSRIHASVCAFKGVIQSDLPYVKAGGLIQWGGSKTPLEELKKVGLKDLKIGEVNRGVWVLVRMVCRPVRFYAVQSVVEDEEGLVVPFSWYHLSKDGYEVNGVDIVGGSGIEGVWEMDVDDVLPVGTVLAIREPLIQPYSRPGQPQLTADPVLRVDTPTDVVRLPPHHPLLKSVTWSQPLPRTEPPKRSASEWKLRADDHFSKKSWRAARSCYERALWIVDHTNENGKEEELDGEGLGDVDDEKLDGFVLESLSNKAMCEIKLTLNGSALRTLSRVFTSKSFGSLPASNLQTIYFRAFTALYNLGRFGSAKKVAEKMSEDLAWKSGPGSGGDKLAKGLAQKAEARLREKKDGDFDFNGIAKSLQNGWFNPIDVAPWTGAVEIGALKDVDGDIAMGGEEGKKANGANGVHAGAKANGDAATTTKPTPKNPGIGLFAARDIAPGDLILLSKPLVSVTTPSQHKFAAGDPGAQKMAGQAAYFSRYDILCALLERLVDYPRWYEDLKRLPGGPDAPNMSDDPVKAGRSLLGQVDDEGELDWAKIGADEIVPVDVDVVLVNDILQMNAFHGPQTESGNSSSNGAQGEDQPAEQPKFNFVSESLFFSPSLINHACLSNAQSIAAGDVTFVRAIRHIKKGEEIRHCFISEPMKTYNGRKKELEKWDGLACRCELCQMDEKDGEKACGKRVSLGRKLDELRAELAGFQQALVGLEAKVLKPKVRLLTDGGVKNLSDDPTLKKVQHMYEQSRGLIDAYIATYSKSRPNTSRPELFPAYNHLVQSTQTYASTLAYTDILLNGKKSRQTEKRIQALFLETVKTHLSSLRSIGLELDFGDDDWEKWSSTGEGAVLSVKEAPHRFDPKTQHMVDTVLQELKSTGNKTGKKYQVHHVNPTNGGPPVPLSGETGSGSQSHEAFVKSLPSLGLSVAGYICNSLEILLGQTESKGHYAKSLESTRKYFDRIIFGPELANARGAYPDQDLQWWKLGSPK